MMGSVTLLDDYGQVSLLIFNAPEHAVHSGIDSLTFPGTMGHDDPPGSGKFLPHLGSLFSLGAGSIAIKHLDKLTIANGMAWSADASSMFFIDTPERKIYAFDFDNQKGTISKYPYYNTHPMSADKQKSIALLDFSLEGNQRVLVDFNDIGPASEVGNPDGMCIDASDNLWVACFGGGRVKCFDSKSGQSALSASPI